MLLCCFDFLHEQLHSECPPVEDNHTYESSAARLFGLLSDKSPRLPYYSELVAHFEQYQPLLDRVLRLGYDALINEEEADTGIGHVASGGSFIANFLVRFFVYIYCLNPCQF